MHNVHASSDLDAIRPAIHRRFSLVGPLYLYISIYIYIISICTRKLYSSGKTISFYPTTRGDFRKDHSTISTIADLTDDLFCNINDGLTTIAAFVDLRKAFDTVNTKILLDKLVNAGIRGNVFNWRKNYLTGRQQCTLANGKKSPMLPVVCGVPQGSVLGPLFFLVYVNDIQHAVGNCGVK